MDAHLEPTPFSELEKGLEISPQRFLLGSDTWINERWFAYDGIMKTYREWLAQLPEDQAKRIAHANAERLFGKAE